MLARMKEKESIKTGAEILKLPAVEGQALLDNLPLEQQTKLVLSLPVGGQRQKLILLSTQANHLVQALPPEDFVWTVKAIGEEDALSLIELSSDEQLTYAADLELWLDGQLDLGRLAYFNELLFNCGPTRTLRWLHSLDFELLVLTMERTVLPVDREDTPDLPDRLSCRVTTPDGYHYLLVKLGADFDRVKKLIDFLYQEDQPLFLALLGNLGTVPLAELQNQALRWRDGRLADRGWPEWEEAMELYQPASPLTATKSAPLPKGLDNAPHYPLEIRFTGRLFASALAIVPEAQKQSVIASQLANLINRVMVADGMPLTEVDSLNRAALRVQGQLEIGLSLLGAKDPESAATLMGQIPLIELFRTAHAAIVKRVTRAKKIQASAQNPLIPMLGSSAVELLDALLSRRPRLYSERAQQVRDFGEPGDLTRLDQALERIETALAIAMALRLRREDLPEPFPENSHPESVEGLSLDSWILTVFGHHCLDRNDSQAPLPARLLPDLFAGWGKDPGQFQEQLSEWLTSQFGKDLPATMDPWLASVRQIYFELSQHDPASVDHRYVEGLWILTE